MKRGLSLYLDLVRVSAALVVLVTHLAYQELSGGMLAGWRLVGNDAVMVFFVLSGFVIAYVSEAKEHSFREYGVSRLARLWSVAVPALLLTILLDQAGRMLDPVAYSSWWYAGEDPLWRIWTALTFTNELWFTSVRPFSNGPYWSLGYEFWYYALFGAVAYFGGWRRLALAGGLALVAGPKILLLLPVWWLGVLAYRRTKAGAVPLLAGMALFLGSAGLYAVFRGSGLPVYLLAGTEAMLGTGFVAQGLRFSNEFVASLIIGPLVAAHFVGAHAIADRLETVLAPHARAIRFAAQSTFTIYLLHYPLLRFADAALGYDERSPFAVLCVFVLVTAACMIVGPAIEQTKDGWRRVLARLVNAGGAIPVPLAAVPIGSEQGATPRG